MTHNLLALPNTLSAGLAAEPDKHWELRFGDPTILGWVTTFGYVLTFVWCLSALVSIRNSPAREKKTKRIVFWSSLAGVMFLLAINKQLDLQMLLQYVGKRIAIAGGWYEERQHVQKIFVLGIALLGISVLGGLGWLCYGLDFNHFIALVGLTLTLFFVVLSASGLHKIDLPFIESVVSSGLHRIFEIAGIILVFISAWRTIERTRLNQHVRAIAGSKQRSEGALRP